MNVAAFGLPGGSFEYLVLAIAVLPALALMLYPLWRICERLGRPGYLSLLLVVPFGLIVLLWVLALADPPAGRSGA